MKQKPYLTKVDVDVLLHAANDFAEKNQFAVTMENLMDHKFHIYPLILLFHHYSQESLLSHAAF